MKNNQPKNAYKGGAEVFKGYVRLSSNENNYGPAKSVKSLIKQTKVSFKKVILLDCHSMPLSSVNLASKKDPVEVVLGDCFGRSCEHEIVVELKSLLT